MIKKENLIALLFTQNGFSYNCPSVVDAGNVIEREFSVDLTNDRWSYQEWKNVKIGKSRSPYDKNGNIVRYGIIGVYDKTNTQHLDTMANDAIQTSDWSKLPIELIRQTT